MPPAPQSVATCTRSAQKSGHRYCGSKPWPSTIGEPVPDDVALRVTRGQVTSRTRPSSTVTIGRTCWKS